MTTPLFFSRLLYVCERYSYQSSYSKPRLTGLDLNSACWVPYLHHWPKEFPFYFIIYKNMDRELNCKIYFYDPVLCKLKKKKKKKKKKKIKVPKVENKYKQYYKNIFWSFSMFRFVSSNSRICIFLFYVAYTITTALYSCLKMPRGTSFKHKKLKIFSYSKENSSINATVQKLNKWNQHLQYLENIGTMWL